MRICLNMIVKNEIENLERCLTSVAPYIACWVIGDTGSTDGTIEFIEKFFEERNIPGKLHKFPFVNFSQARNEALRIATSSDYVFDYLLFTDADMELIVEDKNCFDYLTGKTYNVLQRSGISYWNTRLLKFNTYGTYKGVTHEYLDLIGAASVNLEGLYFIDHASGSNRVDKFERDSALLRRALKEEPENSRYWFYLAQSLRDAGHIVDAAEAYSKRAEMGGWEEEAWCARLNLARCFKAMNKEEDFVKQALLAFNQRPNRAEPLYDLAKFYREKGMNGISLIFAKAGLDIPYPKNDLLFVEDFVYNTGLKEEFSIVAYYSSDPAVKNKGYRKCNELALDRNVPATSRELARSNLEFYMQPLRDTAVSFETKRIDFTPSDNYTAMNASIARQGDRILLLQRSVNYTIMENMTYSTPNNEAIKTRNFLLSLSDDLLIRSAEEVLPPIDTPIAKYPHVQGFEDSRLFEWKDELWCVSCVREFTEEGWCQQVLARINPTLEGYQLTDWRVLTPDIDQSHEKNWMPFVDKDELNFIYKCDPMTILDSNAHTLSSFTPTRDVSTFRGGSQLIPFVGGWLGIIHEVICKPYETRSYRHRFVWFDMQHCLRCMSLPFYLQKKGIEYAAGIAWHPDEKRVIISYSVADKESWLATLNMHDINKMLFIVV